MRVQAWLQLAALVDDDRCNSNRINPITDDYSGDDIGFITSVTKKVVLNLPPSLAEVREMTYLCTVNHLKIDAFIENLSTSKLIGILFNFFYEMPSKALLVMAGLNRKVLNSRRITKLVAPSNPVFSRSFITSFGVAFYKRGAECWFVQPSAPFLLRAARFPPCRDFVTAPISHFPRRKNPALLARLRKKQYICTAKTNQTIQDNEGIFI